MTRPDTPTSTYRRSPRQRRRAEITEALLDGLEALIQRHRGLHTDDGDALHAELVAAEVAHQLAITRSALQRTPAV
ncbi:hypothetical protein SAMN05443637_10726 [Pseudonocardia thermophila]|jgi:hypothetical protein|uniref:Uncharacterized protein n=1 Tax=Pseudonocardia thermophila TaxID=1848 RepID=A0A1M6SY42_PSETH|nr:hypothetical protein [Pseudonocardia thermophila]SHK49570.1 hypothetical protein SAMN05443637_10726 [Pseudonocardia thermophila]